MSRAYRVGGRNMVTFSLREEILLANRLAMQRGNWLRVASLVGFGAQAWGGLTMVAVAVAIGWWESRSI